MAATAMVFAGVSAHGSDAAVRPSGAETAPPRAAMVPTPPLPPATDGPVTETTATTVPEATTTTTTEAPTTTTTVPPEVPPTTAPPTTTITAAVRVPAAVETSRQSQIEAIADSTGFDWRAAGVRMTVGYYPTDCCHWGVYDSAQRTVWIGPSAFATAERLRYVVLHELAHGWQYTRGRFDELIADYRPFGKSTPATALEAGGDCIAAVWGATDHHYWSCPAAALRTAARRLAGDWS